MKINVLARKTHYWATTFVAIPVLVVATSGILLQIKKQWTWVQPPEQRGTGTSPRIGLDEMVAALENTPGLGVRGWKSIERVDIRPSKGLAKVLLSGGREAQVDLGTGKVLQVEVRRSDLIETIHDGSLFAGDLTKLGLFLPAGVALLVMCLTGIWMFWLPISVRRRKARAARRDGIAAERRT